MTWLLAGHPVRSILVTRLRYLGDVVMSTVLLEALKAGDPEVRLGYLCEEGHDVVLAEHPALAMVHVLSAPGHGNDARVRRRNTGEQPRRGQGILGLAWELRRQKYDLAVDLFFNPRSAWLLWLSGISARIGGTPGSRRHLYTHTVLAAEARLACPQLAALAPGGLGDHLARLAPLTHGETGQGFLPWLVGHFAPGSLRPRLGEKPQRVQPPYIVLAPGATWRSKEWPLAKWLALIPELAQTVAPRLRILVPPGREDLRVGLAPVAKTGHCEVLPALALDAVQELLAGAMAVVTVDGGVMHTSVALGVPTVALFGPTDPSLWFPYEGMGPYRVVATRPACHPCDLHDCEDFVCLPDLAIGTVIATLTEVLAETQKGGSNGWIGRD